MNCSTSDPAVVARNQQTTMERHGSSTYRNDSQRRKTCFAKYGVDNNMKSKDGYARYKASLSKNYGVDNVFQRRDVKVKSAATKKAKYGDVNYNNPDKRAATNIAKYGYASATLSPEVMAR